MAGRGSLEAILLLTDAGANLLAPALDDGTPLHQAAWFGQPENARFLVERGAPLDIFDRTHQSSPLGWAVHGSRYSGGASKRQPAYLAVVELLLSSGVRLRYPDDPSDAYFRRLLRSGSRQVRRRLRGERPLIA